MVFDKVRDREWFELPPAIGGPKLYEARNELREKNLHDTEEPPHAKAQTSAPADAVTGRTADGSFNDLSCPFMGKSGTRFGRNTPLADTFPDTANLMNPSPRTVSLELFTRTKFEGVPVPERARRCVDSVPGARLVRSQEGIVGQHPQHPRRRRRHLARASDARADHAGRSTKVAGSTRPPAYINENSHWWDGSQVYGSTAAAQAAIRTGQDGKIKVGSDGRLLIDPVTGLEITGMTDNGWVGLSLLHGLFALEHNAVCDRFKQRNPGWTDERLFQQARLVVSALIAKIHTVEWSTSILPNRLVSTGLRANWRGLLGDAQNIFPGLNDNDLLAGIPGSPTDHHTAPYSLTEEFASVYRMHPLMPDDYMLRSAATNAELGQYELPEMSGQRGRQIVKRFNLADLFYSLGIANPGAIRLHNFPRHLQNLVKDNGERFDLATIDILRDRERGVPRYNAVPPHGAQGAIRDVRGDDRQPGVGAGDRGTSTTTTSRRSI